MTPKEKANELVVKYLRIENTNEWWSKVPAKQCALIAVDELINEASQKIHRQGRCMLSDQEYWLEVKQELQKL